MIVLASFGLAVVLQTSEFIFSVTKFAGVAYLLWLAYQLWKAPTDEFKFDSNKKNNSIAKLARQEFCCSRKSKGNTYLYGLSSAIR